MNLIVEIVSAILLTTTQVYAWYKIIGKETRFKTRDLFVILILSLYSMINLNYINDLVKPILMVLIAIICCKILFKENIIKSFIIVFCQYLLVIILEALMILIFLVILKGNIDIIMNSYIISSIVDLCMCILMFIVLRINILNRFYKFIISHTNKLKSFQILYFLLLVMVCSITIFALTYFNDNIYISIIINITITILYTIIIIIIINTKNKYIEISGKYNTSLDDLQAQESIINEYRLLNHENKNNLQTIKMITTDKKVISYINNLLNQKEKIKRKIIIETLKLPEGGIRGLIYTKLVLMQENGISYYLNVDKKINYKIMKNISDSDIVDICQVLGVFIDNAIEESNSIDNKNINIDLHISCKKIIITISNFYNNKIKNLKDLKSTKGKGRGYGLKLVNKIVDKNKNLVTEREITKELFIQKLEIRIR